MSIFNFDLTLDIRYWATLRLLKYFSIFSIYIERFKEVKLNYTTFSRKERIYIIWMRLSILKTTLISGDGMTVSTKSSSHLLNNIYLWSKSHCCIYSSLSTNLSCNLGQLFSIAWKKIDYIFSGASLSLSLIFFNMLKYLKVFSS